MYLKSITVSDVRNLVYQTVGLGPGLCVLRGRNGQGKTSFLEAVCVACTARSFRTTRAAELVRHGAEAASVGGAVADEFGEWSVEVVIRRTGRDVRVDGKRVVPVASFLGRVPCVTFSPGDLSVVRGPPALRRQFLDRHCVDVDPRVVGPLVTYQRALKQKQVLLRDDARCRPTDLLPWNKLLADSGAAIRAARRSLLDDIGPVARRHYAEMAGDARELLRLTPEGGTDDPDPEELFALLTRSAPREIAARTPLVGPHRDDVSVSLGPLDARLYASQGQARGVVLAMKLAVADSVARTRGEPPVVLLDDFDSELDDERALRFVRDCLTAGRQVIVTTAKGDGPFGGRGAPGDAVKYEVEDGVLTPSTA